MSRPTVLTGQSAVAFGINLHMTGDFVAGPGTELLSRRLPDWELVYFPIPSETVYVMGGHTWLLHKPSLVLTPPRTEHSYHFDSRRPTRHLFVHFDWDPGGDEWGHSPLPVVAPATATPLIGILFPEIVYLSYCQEFLWKIRASQLMAAALCEFIAGARSSHDRPGSGPLPLSVRQALAYMDAHLSEPFRIREMSHSLGWSREHLAREFARSLGQSPAQVLTHKRMARACALLQHDRLPIRQIAQAVGYSDATYFSRRFSQWLGVSANEYRRRCLEDSRSWSRDTSYDVQRTAYPLNEYFHVI